MTLGTAHVTMEFETKTLSTPLVTQTPSSSSSMLSVQETQASSSDTVPAKKSSCNMKPVVINQKHCPLASPSLKADISDGDAVCMSASSSQRKTHLVNKKRRPLINDDDSDDQTEQEVRNNEDPDDLQELVFSDSDVKEPKKKVSRTTVKKRKEKTIQKRSLSLKRTEKTNVSVCQDESKETGVSETSMETPILVDDSD